jgi:lipopolysaccharide assembly outer membrane protein LptD (OstA)
MKHSIITDYTPLAYRIPSLQYKILDHMINASDVQVDVNPTRIDDQNTRLDFQIYANNAQVSGQLLNKSYDNLEITSAYAIYNSATDKMTIHVPYSVALQHIMQ